MNAAPSIGEIAARAPQLLEHTVAPAALAPLPQMRLLELELRAALERDSDSRGWAMLGNLLARRSLYLPARNAYLQAIALDSAFAEAHLAVAELSSILRDPDTTARELAAALRLRRRYDEPRPPGDRTALLLLLDDAPYAVNVPLEFLLDRERIAIHKLFIGESPAEQAPSCDVVFCAFGPADRAVVERARRIVSGRPSMNDPGAIGRCGREMLASALAACEGVTAVSTRRIHAGDMRDIALPSLVRPARTHAGAGLAYIHSPEELRTHLERFPATAYDVTPFIDFRSRDGYYRKYRIVLIEGKAYPYHLAISPRWMVHYQSSPMSEHTWMRDEELAFLRDPAAVFPHWDAETRSIADALGLDYVGVDLTRMPDGTMLVFEADPAVLLHDEEAGGLFDYKRPFVREIKRAVESAILRRAHPSTP